ncbi:SIR2 family protein [Leptospira alexanderi]|uniref:P-loop NTPase n=1 Tax=Leptospira alexanderi TaxID=100053 RepID=UPI000990DDF4|nr:SIR2 family protein [Leptospira alexanderi]
MSISNEIEKIKRRISSGIILFTGAGFSKATKDYNGKHLPLGEELADELWSQYFKNETRDRSTLKDIFHHARKKDPKGLTNYLLNRFRVNPNELPPEYEDYIKFPWAKVYTLNIDNLWEVMSTKYESPFKINPISATSLKQHQRGVKRNLDIIHLNGKLSDVPNDVSFTDEDFGHALIKENPYYTEFSSEFLKQMFFFIGSAMDESLLWKYIQYRLPRKKTYGEKELRPESYFISPSLDLARRNLLDDYNITWLKMTAIEFSNEVLKKVKTESMACVHERLQRISNRTDHITIPTISEKISETPKTYSKNAFLFGHQPEWQDIISQNLIRRELEIETENKLNNILPNPTLFWSDTPIIVISGTAGDGKTSAIMNFAYKAHNSSSIVGWISSEDDIPLHSLKRYIRNTRNLDLLVIDDADIYGIELFDLIKELYYDNLIRCAIVIMRSGRWLSIEKESKTKGLEIIEIESKRMNLREIKELLTLLNSNSLLGKLKEKSEEDRISFFKNRDSADSQLIAALIEATSGRKFDDIIVSEFSQLDPIKKKVYALLSIPTFLRFGLNEIEISICAETGGNEILNAVSKLEQAQLIVNRKNGFRLRHSLIGMKVFEDIIASGQILEYFEYLALGTAILLLNLNSDQKKLRKIRKFCINHKRILEYTANNYDKSRAFFENLENALKQDYHYWLQRGSLELEANSLDAAEIYLLNSLEQHDKDDIVHIQYAYLKLKKANQSQHEEEARRYYNEAKGTLMTMISKRGHKDPYPYHILAHQGCNWLLRSFIGETERDVLKDEYKYILDEGYKKHPVDEQLKQLRITFYKLYFTSVSI